ncbi:MAG: uncharacterized protein JWP01_2781 [Myxococcales bacterium]|nr:uncharacterized protein [Myxococcales bacterium]
MRPAPGEGWILAGTLDGVSARPQLDDDVAGMPYVLRIACDLAHAGARTITVIWTADSAPPSLEAYRNDVRLRGAALEIATSPPPGANDDAILVARADRVYHRDIPKQVAAAWKSSAAPVAKLPGDQYDAIVIVDRARAATLASAARTPGGITAALAGLEIAAGTLPYLAFTVAAPDRRALRAAEKLMVWSLRKQAQGLAAYWINRHISLPVTRAIMRTSILPNHVTVFCFLLAVAGGIVISRGGYLAGVVGMVLVNLGSILDGVDGELARLKYRFSSLGQWLDTLADDFGNVAYVGGIGINLQMAGVTWAMPLAITALACFALTQTTQYVLITKVYKSGDLAAIPWAFQSTEFLTSRPDGPWAWLKVTLPKTLKRDFALTMFVGFALIGRLDAILLVFSAGAIVFFVVFAIQFARNIGRTRA